MAAAYLRPPPAAAASAALRCSPRQPTSLHLNLDKVARAEDEKKEEEEEKKEGRSINRLRQGLLNFSGARDVAVDDDESLRRRRRRRRHRLLQPGQSRLRRLRP
jgi:hypothetical protein